MALSERYLIEPPASHAERLTHAATLLREEMLDVLFDCDPDIPVTVPPSADPQERLSAWAAIVRMIRDEPMVVRELFKALGYDRATRTQLAHLYASWVTRAYDSQGAFE